MDMEKYSFLVPLIVITPLVMAVMLIFIRNYFLSWTLTVLSTASVLSMSIFMVFIAKFQTFKYYFGGFLPPWGIEYQMDNLSSLFILLITIIGFLTSLWFKKNTINEVGKKNAYLFNSMFLLCFSGSLGIVITNDLFNLFVFLEITSLTTYILIAMGNRKNSQLVAFDALIVGTISASFYVFGVGILYLLFGTLNATDMIPKIYAYPLTPTLVLAITMISLGILIKLATFPVFWWLPQTYQSSPSGFSAFLAGTSVNIGLYMFIKVVILVLGRGSFIGLDHLLNIIMIISIISMFLGGIYALKQDSLKLLLAFSSISQIGFITLGLSIFNMYGVASSLYLTITHAFIKAGLFLCVGNLIYAFGTEKISELKGLGKKVPFSFFAIIFLSLSLASIPGTSMFWGKLYLLISTIQSKNFILTAFIVLSSIFSFFYSWKIISNLWTKKDEDEHEISGVEKKHHTPAAIPIYMNIAIAGFIILNIVMTFSPNTVLNFIEQIINLNIIAKG